MPDEVEILETIRTAIRNEIHPHVLSIELHAEQHEFITMLILERKEKTARRERIKEKIAGSLLLAFLFGVVGVLGAGVLQWIRAGVK